MEKHIDANRINLQEVREYTIKAPTGDLLNTFTQRKIRSQKDMEEYQVDNVIYQIPSETGLNTSLWLRRENGSPVPLVAATMQLIDGVPTVVMLQRVITDSATAPRSDSIIPHPYRHLLQGANKISWTKTLLAEQERIASQARYNQLRLTSVFGIPYTKNYYYDASNKKRYYYELRIAVQQYDQVASALGWTPYYGPGQPILNDERKTLDSVLIKLKNNKIKDREGITNQYPNFKPPSFWQKTLT